TKNRANPKINFIWNTVAEEIIGTNNKVTSVRLRNVLTNETQDYPTDGVFVFVGHDPNSSLFTEQLKMDEHGYVITDASMCTSVEGVFAAGENQGPARKERGHPVGQGAAAGQPAEEGVGQPGG